MKRVLFLFGLFILMSLPVMATATVGHAGSFPDVPEDHENYAAIEYLDTNGVINGYQDGTFGPEDLVTRAQAMKIVVGALGIDFSGTYSQDFPDVIAETWYFPYVMAGFEEGVINGYDDGTFKPGENVNLAELLKIIVLAANAELPTVESDVFADVSADIWFAPHTLYARNNNIIFPDEYGLLNAQNSMTRAAFSEVVYRMMIVLQNDQPYPLDENWDMYTSSTLPFKIKYDSDAWEVNESENEVMFFRSDKEYLNFSPLRLYPNSAVLSVTVDENSEGSAVADYFGNVKNIFTDADYTEFTVTGLSALEVLYTDDRIVDWYIYLEDGRVLVVYTEFGNGTLGYQLMQYIKAMLSTLEYSALGGEGADYTQLLSEIFENILVENKGMEMLNRLPDKIIIETDTIGVGTGPVDYYYSEGADYTFKYERADDVILDTREGQTTAF
ncbi:MAG: S-layer homology domain-containing protein [Nitrospirota bacterium]